VNDVFWNSLAAVTTMNVWWDITQRGTVKKRRFGGIQRIHFQGNENLESSKLAVRISINIIFTVRDKFLFAGTVNEPLFTVRREACLRYELGRFKRLVNPEDGGDMYLGNVRPYQRHTV
jgi:hypothetical protein